MNALKFGLWIASLSAVGILAHAQQSATNTPNATVVANPVEAVPLSEAEIAHVMSTANKGEVDAGKLAAKKAKHKDVKDFAKMMVQEHQKNDKDAKTVLKKGKIKSKDNDVSKVLKRNSKDQIDSLKKLKDQEFDKAYIVSQIAMHEQVLATLEDKLIPAAQSPELKAHLEVTKNHVQSHLAKAKDLEIIISK